MRTGGLKVGLSRACVVRYTSFVLAIRVRIALVLLGIGALLSSPLRAQEQAFIYAAIVDLHTVDSWVNRDSLAALKLNAVSTWATTERPEWSLSVPSLAPLGINIWGTNGMTAKLPPSEQGYIIKFLHRRSRQRSLYGVWQAEDTTAFGSPPVVQLRHPIGARTASGWEVREGRDTAGLMQVGPRAWIGGGTPAKPLANFVEYAIRLNDAGSLRPETPVCRLFADHLKRDCQFAPLPLYDSTLYLRDLLPVGEWHRVLFRYDLARGPDNLAEGCDSTAKTAASLNFNVLWYGLGDLELDWTRGMDTNGWELVLGPDSLRRGPIKRQAGHFKDDPVTTWFADESGWGNPYKVYAYFFADSLVRDTTAGRAGVITDQYIGQLNPRSSWDYFMYQSIVNGQTGFYPWLTPFREARPWAHDVDSIQKYWYDPLLASVDRDLKPWIDTVPGAFWVPYVQVWSDDPRPDVEVAPTSNDVVCQVFLYIAHGARGVLLYRYDGGVWSNNVASWGLTYEYRGARVYSRRYYAVRDRVTPLIVDAGWGETLARLHHRGAGSVDTVRRIAGSFVRSVRSNRRPMYLEAGFWDDSLGGVDYLMLVNRRTPDREPQTVTVELEKRRLRRPQASSYLVTDMQSGNSMRLPANRMELRDIEIGPGDPRFFRIEGVP